MNLLEIAVLEARRKVYLEIGETHIDGMAMDEACHVISEAVIDLVNQLPAHDTVSPLLAGVGLEGVYRYALDERMQTETLQEVVEELARRYPPSPTPRMLACPRGCNYLHTCAGYDECGACGAIMTPEEYGLEEDDFEKIEPVEDGFLEIYPVVDELVEGYPELFKDLILDGPKLGTWYVGFTVKFEYGVAIHEVSAIAQYVGAGKFINKDPEIDLGPLMRRAD